MNSDVIIGIGYLVAALGFIGGLKALSRPRTAVRGNQMGAAAMLIAVVVTMLDQAILSYTLLAIGLIVGGAIGLALAIKVEMTGMPQLVALFNGFGGGASVLVGIASFVEAVDGGSDDVGVSIAAAAAVIIGAITVTGSIVAFGKLQELLKGGGQTSALRALNVFFAIAGFVFIVGMVTHPGNNIWLWGLVMIGLVAGITLVVPIGGADMPVVIALLNSFSGLAASASGFVLDNPLLIIAGSLVGASGLILTRIMCVAMNRTLIEVLFADLAPSGDGPNADDVYGGKVTSASPEEVAMILETADRVCIVPGYGMAVAQAQHAVRDLCRTLEQRGTEVTFAIHPVAGRMPGHMNVLLAEAEVPYELLVEMDEANPAFERTDVVIVIGANDVVNPSAREDPESAIAGMPILDVDRARTVVVIKRSLSPGFAQIPNPLFAADNALMLFGDGREAVVEISRSLAGLTV